MRPKSLWSALEAASSGLNGGFALEVLIAFIVGMVAFVVAWATGLGGMVSLVVLLAILMVGVTAHTLARYEANGE